MPCRRVRTPVEHLQLFERVRMVGLREAGWIYRRIAAHVGYNGVAFSSVCETFPHP